jgi:hypothetical protein
MPPHISAPNHKDIALSQRHALGLSNLIQLIDPDLVPRVRRRSIPVRLLPLRARLGVHMDLVVQRREAMGREIHDLVFECLAADAGEVDIVEGPVELDAAASLHFLVCCEYDCGGEEVEC